MNMSIGESARERIIDVLSAEDASKRVRVSVQGGGCSGYQYGFDLDDALHEDDTLVVVTPQGSPRSYEVVIDCMSLTFLSGATLQYSAGEWDAKFYFDNPNAESTCGCGSSFSV
jgi:iron-sulfur cluster insertion protein